MKTKRLLKVKIIPQEITLIYENHGPEFFNYSDHKLDQLIRAYNLERTSTNGSIQWYEPKSLSKKMETTIEAPTNVDALRSDGIKVDKAIIEQVNRLESPTLEKLTINLKEAGRSRLTGKYLLTFEADLP